MVKKEKKKKEERVKEKANLIRVHFRCAARRQLLWLINLCLWLWLKLKLLLLLMVQPQGHRGHVRDRQTRLTLSLFFIFYYIFLSSSSSSLEELLVFFFFFQFCFVSQFLSFSLSLSVAIVCWDRACQIKQEKPKTHASFIARGTTLQLDSCIWWRCLIYMSGNWTILVLLVLQGGDDLVRLRPC